MISIDARGHCGDIALLWRFNDEVELLGISVNYIDLKVTMVREEPWRLIRLYGEPNRSLHAKTWDQIRTLHSASILPWCIIRDLNNVLSNADKKRWPLLGSYIINVKCFGDNVPKQLWLREGDQNSKFFHAKATTRKKNNTIHSLKNNSGVWIDWEGGLANHVSPEEVKKLCFKCIPTSPRDRRNDFGFYQKYWDVVGNDVICQVTNFFNSCSLPEGRNQTNIVLIPKKKHVTTMGDLRPISLCNVLYKVISKVLANRLKVVLPSVISENQSAFIPRRLISDNIMIAFEVMHYLKRKSKGMTGFMELKLDLSKAYDRIEWGFLKAMMLLMCIVELRNVKLIMLFDFCIPLRLLLDRRSILTSLLRSLVLIFRSICVRDFVRLGMKAATENNLYLGLPCIIGQKKKAILGFLEEVMEKRILSWEGKFLSKAGREILLKTVAQALLSYAMSVFLILLDTCSELEKLIAKYWWGNLKKSMGISWISWNHLCKHQSSGGIGFQNLHDYHLSLLGKQAWRLLFNETSFDAEVVKDLFEDRDRDLILSIPLNSNNLEDKWYWFHENSGCSYQWLQYAKGHWSAAMESDLWRVLWKTKVPLKVLHFVWKAISGCLSTNLQLHSKHVPVQLQCMFCSREEESIMHVLIQC
uniref:Reverse transcriptase domain-containing protein n=1 Tax=Cannabis sativa TaxID=3483 RepID=A0A803PBY7_CANSA